MDSTTSTCINSILDELKLKLSNFNLAQLDMLNMELKLVRTFFLCSNHVSILSSTSSLSRIQDAIQETGQHFLDSLSVRIVRGSFPVDLANGISNFRRKIKFFKQEISGLYISLSNCSSFPPPSRDEFMEFIVSLGENMVDMLRWVKVHDKVLLGIIEPLEEKLLFFKDFLGFFILRKGLKQRELEHFLIHSQVVAVNAARLFYMCWFDDRYDGQVLDEIKLKISELAEKINPIHSETYFQVLTVLNLSGSPLILTMDRDKSILGDFVDHLLGKFWGLLLDDGTNFMVSGKLQIQILYEGLKFLRNILKNQQEKLDGLHEHIKDLIGAVINEAGIFMVSIYVHQMKEGLAEEMLQTLFGLLEKIEHIKAEVDEQYPVKSTFNFPTTNELEFIDLILENLKELASSNVDSIFSIKDVVQTVQEDLLFLRSFMESIVEQRSQHGKLQAFWDHVIEVANEAEVVIDSLIVGGISNSSIKLFNSIVEEIKLAKTKALEIDDIKYVYTFKAQKACKTLSHMPLQGTISTINEVVVGLNDEAEAIIDQLTRGSMQLDIVSIVGMPGLGKTTLAKRVYHDALIIRHFHILAWCFISQVYNRKDLLIEILVCIFPKNSNRYSKMNEDDLAEELYKRLKGNKYVIVLDDIWDIEAWNALKISFPNDANGSRILLTSRLSDVALLVKPTGNPYPLRQLTDDESLELLQKKLVGKEGYPPALLVFGEQIARNCNGLPFTVVLIAGILATLEQSGWEEVAERLSSNIIRGTEQCMNMLELSYRHLPDFLKPCLLYFGAFLEDKEIPVWKLMRLWIAEGFVQKNEKKSLEDVAEDYTTVLISRSLIMVSKQRPTGEVKTCRIHDLLHEFCVTKAKEENFVQQIHGYDEMLNFYAPPNLRRLCIYSQQKHLVKSRLFCPRIRSLLFFAEGGSMSYEISYKLSFCFLLKLLRVLDLEQINLGSIFPSEIVVLVHLRYLAVRGKMRDIPSSIANLSNLETFLVTVNLCLSFPDAIWNMQKLRYVKVRGEFIDLSFDIDNSEGSPDLHNLDTFSTPNLYVGESMEKILKKIPNIRKLKCCLFALESKKSVVMDFLRRLESMNLILYEVNVRQMEFLFPLNLKKLTLRYFSLSLLSNVGKLPNLEVLKLICGHGIETWEMEDGDFPKLKFLKLEAEIIRWKGSGDHFPCLQKLIFNECKKLEELPCCLAYISTLDLIGVHYCSESVVSLVQDIKEEQMSMGYEDLEVFIVQNIKEEQMSMGNEDLEVFIVGNKDDPGHFVSEYEDYFA